MNRESLYVDHPKEKPLDWFRTWNSQQNFSNQHFLLIVEGPVFPIQASKFGIGRSSNEAFEVN